MPEKEIENQNPGQSNNNPAVDDKSQADKLYQKPEDNVPADDKKVDPPADDKSQVKPEGDLLGGEKKADDPPEGKKADEKPGDKVEYVIPEIFKDHKEVVDEVLKFAEEQKLSKEQTQVLLNREASIVDNQTKSQNALLETRKSEWAAASAKDPEFGGENFEGNLKIAEHGFTAAPKTIQDFLKSTGMVNHPDVIRFFLKIGKSGMGDKLVPAGNEIGEKPKSYAERLYSKTN
jgi:hypothetical protein